MRTLKPLPLRPTIGVAFFFIICISIPSLTSSGATQLNTGNLNDILQNHDLVFINFYADWCRFSQILKPIFDEAAAKVIQEFTQPGKVLFGKVDCDDQGTISQQYKVNKYPTLKLIRHGQPTKREYRGQRSVEALVEYIRDQLKDVVKEHESLENLENLDQKKRNMIGYFASKDTNSFKNYEKVASLLREDCEFHAVIGPASQSERKPDDKVVFRPPDTERQDQFYPGSLQEFDQFKKWAADKCVPLVREITFENAEELTEEGLPFVILFYHPLRDSDVIKRFTDTITKHLIHERVSVNFLTADGIKFSHPLYHLGKTEKDLPVLAIDSFRHMYIYKHDVKTHIDNKDYLQTFISDLHSGKLHREFHHGPDPETTPEPSESKPSEPDHVPKDTSEQEAEKPKKPTSPPESTFKKLGPSHNRYTILDYRDEL